MCMCSMNPYLCQMSACINFVTVLVYMSTMLLPGQESDFYSFALGQHKVVLKKTFSCIIFLKNKCMHFLFL